MDQEKKGYKDTLNLPRTEFKMKANLPQREPEMLKKWEEKNIYKSIIANRKGSGKSFILHDGPPYANGHIHMGHVLNKILKDICVKYKTMNGCLSPYVPGWDCHGLPIEHQLFKELNITKHDIPQIKFRKKAYKYAMKFVKIQTEEFKRLGIFADWENPYVTLTKDYEADILSVLADLYDKGYIYKDLKPVNWCKRCETALAEAEVEYEDKKSPSVFVKFSTGKDIENKSASFVIWTTTPWTLLANVAVALHPDFMYSTVSTGEEVLILASELVDTLAEKAGIENYKILDKKTGAEIVNEFKSVKHPFIDRGSTLVLADYVTKDEGTGCVHTAPGHGQDDFITGKKNSLPVIMPVDDRGKFVKGTGEFSGHDVIEANGMIIEKMRANGSLIFSEEVTHSYPHCWRCKEPIIFRATEQWFMNIDHLDLRKKMGKVIANDVEWIPGMGKERIGSMVQMRPDWCLSRQRYWGVPIPAFKCLSCGKTFTNSEVIRKTSELTRQSGADIWFEADIETLRCGIVCECGSKELKKEEDILDVWFDSGVSHKAVLDARDELERPADLYLEGSDQHRGWFQAALITSMAVNGEAPYRKVLTHGVVVDGEGKKMSKSVGNVISPEEIMKKYGADILRLWVASSDYEGDVKLSEEILARLADGYRKIRNTFRFLLSNLYDFDPSEDIVNVEDLGEIDRWMMSRLSGLITKVNSSYEKWEFYKVYRTIYDFCVYEISAFYLDVSKDLLYIEPPGSHKRRSIQTVIFRLLNNMVRLLAPIMSFTSEEIWQYMSLDSKEESVHMSNWPGLEDDIGSWKDEALDLKWKEILSIRESVMKVLELKREKGGIGSSLEASINLYSQDKKFFSFIDDNIDIFPALFKVSQANVLDFEEEGMEEAYGLPVKIGVHKAKGEKCQRCWSYTETVGKNKDFNDLCERCYNVISERSRNG